MKKLILICLMAFVGFGVCSAQKQAGKKGATTVVFATDLDCESCVNKIMNNVPSLGKGIKDVKADVKTKELTVVFDASKNEISHIVKGLESLKVKATPKTVDGKAVACPKAGDCQKKCCESGKTCDKQCCEAKCCESGKPCAKGGKAACADKCCAGGAHAGHKHGK